MILENWYSVSRMTVLRLTHLPVKKGTQLFGACPMRHASTRGRLAGVSAGIPFGKTCIKGGLEACRNKWSEIGRAHV